MVDRDVALAKIASIQKSLRRIKEITHLNPESLEMGKLYRIISNENAESHGYIRVVDESGEDYGYSEDRFYRLEVPQSLEKTFLEVLA